MRKSLVASVLAAGLLFEAAEPMVAAQTTRKTSTRRSRSRRSGRNTRVRRGVLGGAAGAGVGALIGGGKGAAIGAAAGGATGAALPTGRRRR